MPFRRSRPPCATNRCWSNASSEAALPRPEIQITPKADEAARLGVTVRQIATVVRVATIGDVSAALGKLSIDNRLVPIRVQLDEASRDNLARISALKIQTATGPVPLSAVATVEVAEGPSVVKRLNRQRVATIGADIAPGFVLDQATARFQGNPADAEPAGLGHGDALGRCRGAGRTVGQLRQRDGAWASF